VISRRNPTFSGEGPFCEGELFFCLGGEIQEGGGFEVLF